MKSPLPANRIVLLSLASAALALTASFALAYPALIEKLGTTGSAAAHASGDPSDAQATQAMSASTTQERVHHVEPYERYYDDDGR